MLKACFCGSVFSCVSVYGMCAMWRLQHSSWRGVSCQGKWPERKGESDRHQQSSEACELYSKEEPNTQSLCVCVSVCTIKWEEIYTPDGCTFEHLWRLLCGYECKWVQLRFGFWVLPLDDFCDLGLPVSHALLFISQLPHLILQLLVGAAHILKHAGQLSKHTEKKNKTKSYLTS